MKITRKFIVIAALALIVVLGMAAVIVFFGRMYMHDLQTLTDFPIAYDKFDRAMSALTAAVISPSPADAATTAALEAQADAALADLSAKASVRISSLIKNEKEVMAAMTAAAGAAGQELAALRDYRRVSSQGAQASLQQQVAALEAQRQAGYVRFQDFAEMHK